MELIVALVVGLLVGAGLVFTLLRGAQVRAELALVTAQNDVQVARDAQAVAKESLARIEAQR